MKRPINLQGRNYSFVSPQAQQEIRVILVWDTILTWDDPHTLSLKCSTSLGKAYGDVILTENGPLTFVKHSDVTHYTRENTILDRNDPHTNCSQCYTPNIRGNVFILLQSKQFSKNHINHHWYLWEFYFKILV